MFKWTIDVETDWGGRSDEWNGVKEGIPIILKLFEKYNVKGLFFFSTELLDDFFDAKPSAYYLAKKILAEGHTLGSHGHFHMKYPTLQRLVEDRRLSEKILRERGIENPQYRAPKFDKRTWDWSIPYSNPKNHLSLLKILHFKIRPNKETIFYIHPFDIIGSKNPPNLFCRLWYSKPNKALQLLEKLIQQY